jgi:hypothetical protein
MPVPFRGDFGAADVLLLEAPGRCVAVWTFNPGA